jgi:hypothetical protein
MQESRETYDGTLVSWEAQQTHPPLLMRLRALLRFATTDACLKPWGKSGGGPVMDANRELVETMNQHVDAGPKQQIEEALRMVKAWFYCAKRARGEACDLPSLNAEGPTVDESLLEKAWNSLASMTTTEISLHAGKRLKASIEKALPLSPDKTQELVRKLMNGNPTHYFS